MGKKRFPLDSEEATGGVLLEKVFLEISQNSQENTCASLFFNKVAGLQLAKFLRTTFLQNTPRRLLLKISLMMMIMMNDDDDDDDDDDD